MAGLTATGSNDRAPAPRLAGGGPRPGISTVLQERHWRHADQAQRQKMRCCYRRLSG